MCLLAIPVLLATPATAQSSAETRAIVQASAPSNQAVTVYRDPNRRTGQSLNANNPRGFAMISETRTVTLPPGRSTIRFEGVAEGMVAVSAIVTGLPGGTIEKNRNADLLGPAALVDGTLGNRVEITRANPATGALVSETAIVRTRADGGLVLQTSNGYEAVRCSGLPERLTFNAVPDGLSAEPVFSIDTRDDAGGTYVVTLSYLSWGFDWQANYVATVLDEGDAEAVRFNLVSWLTLLNDNGQSFEDAELLVVAGKLNVTSNFQALANPPRARPLQLTCYPIGSTAAGSPIPDFTPPRRRDEMRMLEDSGGRIMVTASRMMAPSPEASPAPPPPAMIAQEENLGDLKLYRVPERVTVSAQGLKQVAFLNQDNVEGRLLYTSSCQGWSSALSPQASAMVLETANDEDHGLGMALPTGGLNVFARGAASELLIAQDNLRDYASGQDVEVALGVSNQVFSQCEVIGDSDLSNGRWITLRTTITNANPSAATMRLYMGSPAQWNLRGITTRLKDGQRITEVEIPQNGERVIQWQVRRPA